MSIFVRQSYAVASVNGSSTITGGAPQTMPNFTSGASYQLTAQTTSGLPVAYSVTSGDAYASVSGTTLTVSAVGPVTIQAAAAADPTGDYALATPAARSFTAQ